MLAKFQDQNNNSFSGKLENHDRSERFRETFAVETYTPKPVERRSSTARQRSSGKLEK